MSDYTHPTPEQRAFLHRLPLLAHEAMTLGLPITSRAIHNAVRASGWEAAGEPKLAAAYAPNTELTLAEIARSRP